jgi:hypothetical protein
MLSANDAQISQVKNKTAGILSSNPFGNSMVPTDDVKDNYKERVQDSIWSLMAKRAIRMITTSTVNWINNGFQGGPAYVTDLNGFLLDVADDQTSIFIERLGLTDLCSPWKLDIRIALAMRQAAPFDREIACTLSDIVANMDDFINGDFSQGGWAGWFELTTKPQNNPYGLYLMTASELDQRIAGTQQRQTQILDWGDGFLSYEECEDLPEGFGGPPRCEIVTPGTVIENQLDHVLGTGVRQLELADEFNEVINALMQQLVVQVFTGVDGLRGVSRSYGGNPSYTNRLSATEDNTTIGNVIASSELEFGRVLNEELVYLTAKDGSLKSIEAAENRLSSLVACYDNKLADISLNLTISEKTIALERRNSASSTIDTLITPRKNILITEIDFSSRVILKLDSLLTNMQNATNPIQLQVPTSELESMRRQDILRGPYIFSAEQERVGLLSEMNALNQDTENKITECQVFPLLPQGQQQNP